MYSLVCFTDPFMQLEFAIFGRDELKAYEYEKKTTLYDLYCIAYFSIKRYTLQILN